METLIPLLGGGCAVIDAEDFERVAELNWRWHGKGDKAYVIANYKGKRVLLHRFIMNAAEGVYIDHKNLNRRDCRKDNLRPCTKSQNGANCLPRGGRKYKGVHYYKARNRYQVTINKDGKQYNLGYFDSDYQAAKTYDMAAVFLYGEFAKTNFPVDFPKPIMLPKRTPRKTGPKPKTKRD